MLSGWGEKLEKQKALNEAELLAEMFLFPFRAVPGKQCGETETGSPQKHPIMLRGPAHAQKQRVRSWNHVAHAPMKITRKWIVLIFCLVFMSLYFMCRPVLLLLFFWGGGGGGGVVEVGGLFKDGRVIVK